MATTFTGAQAHGFVQFRYCNFKSAMSVISQRITKSWEIAPGLPGLHLCSAQPSVLGSTLLLFLQSDLNSVDDVKHLLAKILAGYSGS